ncbi:MAG: isoprenylcysteine carboxylmethyltransferase family protein [Terracidiphilus sp.]
MLQLSPLRVAALAELLVCWVAWSLAFVKPRKLAAGKEKVVRAPASRWGIFLVCCGFAAIWAYVRPAGFEKSWPSLILSMILAPPSVALAWSATRHLGKQWRYEAALSEDHELIRTGPYRWIRHPIYASMLGMLIATGAAWTWWPMWIAATILFLIGTEIRVAAEDRLLAERFQESFQSYRSGVRAYIPFVR